MKMIVANTKDQGIINAEISVPLKYFCNIWRALEISSLIAKLILFGLSQQIFSLLE